MKAKKAKKIFIIEDDQFMQEILNQELSQLSQVEVQLFSSAEECLPCMNQEPELVILDYFLNGENSGNMNGHEALHQLRARNKSQKVIFISGGLELSLLEEYKCYRSVDYVKKSEWMQGAIVQKVKHQLFAA